MTRIMLSLGIFVTIFCGISTRLHAEDYRQPEDEIIDDENKKIDLDVTQFIQSDTARPLRSRPSRYPVVLLHGFLGWDRIFDTDYFYQVKATLEEAGFEVFTPVINPVQSIVVRAHELAPQIKNYIESRGHTKVNIIAHSMGGLDARYLISQLGFAPQIASLTTIGSPHRGSPVPNMIFKLLGRGDNIFYRAFEYLVAGFIAQGRRDPSELNLRANLWNLTPEFMNGEFNIANPNHPDIYYQSYAGVTSITGWGSGDKMDSILLPFQPAFGLNERNDGLVPLESAKWGRFRGIASADHIDLIGQMFGNTSANFQHLSFYKYLAQELVDLGF